MKKLIALFLTVCMVAAFAGCDKKDGGDKAKDPSKLTSAEIDAETFKGFKFETNPDLDFGGKTITVARDTIPKEGISALYDREITVKKAMEEKYNVKIEWIEYGAADSPVVRDNVVLNHLSGNAYSDVMFTTTPLMLSLLTNDGIFRSLDDYLDYSNERFALTSKHTKYVDGKHYSYYPTKTETGYMIYYNTEILAANNCQDPRELYEAGNWNWKTFGEIVKACTGQKNGKTIYGLAGSNILDGIVASNGLSVITHKDGKAECSLFTDAGKNALEFLRTLTYTYKAVDGTYGSHNGIETFENSYAAMMITPQYSGQYLVGSGVPLEIVPLPIGDDADSYTNLGQFSYCYSINSHSEYKTEDLLQLMFELERNDPSLGENVYRTTDYQGRLDAFIEQYLDQEPDYVDDEQAKFAFDFINDEKTVTMVDWLTTDIKEIIVEKIYTPIANGESVRSQLAAVESVIKEAVDKQF